MVDQNLLFNVSKSFIGGTIAALAMMAFFSSGVAIALIIITLV